MSFFQELKRRSVFKIAVAYAVVAWLIAQIVSVINEPLHLPDWFDTAIIVVLLIGFPIALLIAWAFELSPEGIKRTGPTEDTDAAPTNAAALTPAPKPTPEPQPEPGPPNKSIAVLPFTDMSPDKDHEYFSDGISEELLNLLTRVPDLKVIARTSSFYYKGKDVPLTQIARELNVAHILEGSVRKAGDRVRITAQLIRVKDSSHLWSESYDRTLEDIFAIQDQVAAAVVKELKIKLLNESPTTTPVDAEAYKLYLQGRHLVSQNTFDSYQKAIAVYQQALEIEPDYAPAWAASGHVHGLCKSVLNLDDHVEPARQAANRALALDPNHALAYEILFLIATSESDLAEAARCLERALALDPKDVTVLWAAASLLSNLGRIDKAIEVGEYSVAVDPVNSGLHTNLTAYYVFGGRWDAAIRAGRAALDLNPGQPWARYQIGTAIMAKGDHEAALLEIDQENDSAYRLLGLTTVYHALGRTTESDAALNQLIEAHDPRLSLIARAYASRGEADKAFHWLDRSAHGKEPLLYMQVPSFAGLHEDPRWLLFLERIGRSPAQLAKIEFNFTLPA